MKHSCFTGIILLIVATASAQSKIMKTEVFLPKDSTRYEKLTDLEYHYGGGDYGNTQLIIHCVTQQGDYKFVFTKKVRQLDRIIDFKNGEGIYQTYDQKSRKWVYGENSRRREEIKSQAKDTTEISNHDLYAFVLLQDHGGVVEKAVFKDFGNEVYWPEFEYNFCSVSDEDKDGSPEFYLSYMGNSDGLDPKPFKQIIYTLPSVAAKGKSFVKSKATAYYPVMEDDTEATYHIEYDANWTSLPEAVKKKSSSILKKHHQLQQ